MNYSIVQYLRDRALFRDFFVHYGTSRTEGYKNSQELYNRVKIEMQLKMYL